MSDLSCFKFFMIMKRILLLLAIAASMLSIYDAKAQTRSVNLELLGSSGAVGANYDARFKGNYGFGYSAGLGYGYLNSNYDFVETPGRDGVSHQVVVPVEVNYLFGKNNNHLVLGAGALLGVLVNEGVKKPHLGYNVFADIAYRYQKPSGFTFAVGFKPNLREVFWPYITFGYSF